jgi:hypothetical protein
MIRRIIPGILVLGLVTGLSGTLAGHLWNRFSQPSEFGFTAVYDRYFARVARIADDVFSYHAAPAPARVQQASALFEE